MFSKRREKVQELMLKQKIDTYLVLHAANRYYLSGFELQDPQCNESSGCLILRSDGKHWLCTDPRYQEEARKCWPEDQVFIYRGKRMDQIGSLLTSLGCKQVSFEENILDYASFESLSDHVTAEPVKGLVEDVRLIKDHLEIDHLQKSCALNHQLMKHVEENYLVPGITEQELSWEIEKYFREHGAESMAFTSIVAVGANGAKPHAIPGKTRLQEGKPLLVDTGCRLNSYCSDQTRTFWVGNSPSDRFKKTLEQVQEAQQKALDLLEPGLPRKKAYEAARSSFAEHGVEQFFTHGLGHGIGLETHEMPGISHLSEGKLEPGMVITIEPGLYYPEWGGVRWEYMVRITDSGYEVM